MHDTAPSSEKQLPHLAPFFDTILRQVLPLCADSDAPRGRGAPQKLSWPHLWYALILSVLLGMNSYQDLWRRLTSQSIGSFPRLTLTDDAIIKRLKQAGVQPLQDLLAQLSQVLSRRLRAYLSCDLAPFASAILALDAHHVGCRGTPPARFTPLARWRRWLAARETGGPL